MTWACDACTFENPPATTRCGVCNTPKQYLQSVKSSQLKTLERAVQNFGLEVTSFFVPYPDMKGCASEASQILEHLYLSGSDFPRNAVWLAQNRVTHILNCADDVRVEAKDEVYDRIVIKKVALDDVSNASEKFASHLSDIISFLRKASGQENAVILVNCSAGVSRSAAVVVAFLMETNNWDLKTSFQYVRDRRRFVYPNLGFWRILVKLDQSSSIEENALDLHAENGNLFQAVSCSDLQAFEVGK